MQSGSLGSCQEMNLLVLHCLRKPCLFFATGVSHTAYIKTYRLSSYANINHPTHLLPAHGCTRPCLPQELLPFRDPLPPSPPSRCQDPALLGVFPWGCRRVVSVCRPPPGPAERLIPALPPRARSLPAQGAFWEGKYTTKISKLQGGLTFERPFA